MKTVTVNPKTIEKKWLLIDANDVVLGRLASKVATILMGKNKTAYAPNEDYGDNVIIINAEKVALTGKKRETMRYFAHSTHPGGWRTLSVAEVQKARPGFPIRNAVRKMLPKTILGENMAKKLFIYDGASHPHAAQKPEAFSVK